MTTTIRTELPWDKINVEVCNATKAFTKSQFVSTKQLAEFILESPTVYPTIVASKKCTISRITMSMRRQNWVSWSSKKDGGKQKVFVIPEGVRA